MLRDKDGHRKFTSAPVVAKQVDGPLQPRDLDRADRCSSQGPGMTCSKERLLYGRYHVSFVPQFHPPRQPMAARGAPAHRLTARDRSLDDAKHTVSLSKSPPSDIRGPMSQSTTGENARRAVHALGDSHDAGNSGSACGDLV
jgi:hypothetical protein